MRAGFVVAETDADGLPDGGGTLLAIDRGHDRRVRAFPRIDGFPLLSAALVPFLLFGMFLSTRRTLVGSGIGYCIFFCFLAGPDNLTHYDPTGFINDAIALVLSMLVVVDRVRRAAADRTPWLRNRLLMSDLRREVVLGCRARLGLGAALREPHARPAFADQRARADRPVVQRDTLRWLFSVLEIGHAVIDLRRELAAPTCACDRHAVARSIATTLDAVARLFDGPCGALRAALTRLHDAIADVQSLLDSRTCRRAKSVTGCNAS